MSSANVLSSAPFEESLYPQLPSQPENFRLQKSATIASLPKNRNGPKNGVNWSAAAS